MYVLNLVYRAGKFMGTGTYVRQVILNRYLLSRIALRLLKIVEPDLVEQERMANAQLLRYGSKHLEQNS
jgi:hypothetical protein